MTYIFMLALCFSTLLYSKENNFVEDSLFIYLVKYNWHTGILFEVSRIDTMLWPEISDLQQFKYIDVGWGDEEFYQHPGFDPVLAAKALFYPTKSTIRIEGITYNLSRYAEIMDLVIKIPVSVLQYNALCKYVSDTFVRDSNYQIITLSESYGGNIKFYKAKYMYHIFNTCNTWVAKGLLSAGFDICPAQIIFVKDLIKAAYKFGSIVNYETPE